MGTHSDGKSITIGGFKGPYFENKERCTRPLMVGDYTCFELGSPHPCERCADLQRKHAQ